MMIICKEIITEKTKGRRYSKIQKDPIKILTKLFSSDEIEVLEEKPFIKEDVEYFIKKGFYPKTEYTKIIFKVRNKIYYINKVVTL